MKYILTAFALLFVFGACQKEINGEFDIPNIDTTPTTPPVGILRAKINGVQWVADKDVDVVINPYDSGRHFALFISGEKLDSTTLGIVLEDFRTGGFNLVDSFFNGAGYNDTTGEYATANGPSGVSVGAVAVTSIDTAAKTISGTFYFTAYTDSGVSINVTDGEFINLPYIQNAGVPAASPYDTFYVTKDSILFEPYGIIPITVDTTSLIFNISDSLGVKTMYMQMPFSITVGNYKFDSTHTVYYLESGSDTLIPRYNTGSLQITERDLFTKRIKGNFSFTGYNSASPPDSSKFTMGHFSIVYP